MTAVSALFAASCSSPASPSASSAAPVPSSQTEDHSQTEEAVGGWQLMEDETITDELQAVFDKASEGLTGVSYTPYICLARQVVSGTNYALLCSSVTVTAEPKKDFAIVYVNEDLKGNAKILDIVPLEFAGKADTLGKWEVADSPEIYNELSLVFSKGMEGFTGSDLSPCIYLGWQLVDGTNYALLCRKSTVAVKGDTSWAIVTIHEDLDGSAKITDIRDLQIAMPDKEKPAS